SLSHETETILQARTPNYPVYCLPSAKGFGPTTTNEAHYKVLQTALPSVSYLDNSQMPGHTVSTAPTSPPFLSFPSYIVLSLSLYLSLTLFLLEPCPTARSAPPPRARTSHYPNVAILT
ncbi:unnamed protein product, partial [Ixodes pacificus]